MANTTYRLQSRRTGVVWETDEPDRAEAMSNGNYRVTAITEGSA